MGLKRRGEHPPYRYPASKPTTVNKALMDKIEQIATAAQCPRECSEHHTFDPPCLLAVPDVIRVVPGLITTKPWEPNLGVAAALVGLAVTLGMVIAWLIR